MIPGLDGIPAWFRCTGHCASTLVTDLATIVTSNHRGAAGRDPVGIETSGTKGGAIEIMDRVFDGMTTALAIAGVIAPTSNLPDGVRGRSNAISTEERISHD
tara:strand:- start:903 stop:1208 length:306 start_codon:yes stop_codon:yes gene_type:complete